MTANYEQARKWINDHRVALAYRIMPHYRRCGCALKPFPMYSPACPLHNPRGPADAAASVKLNPDYFRGVANGRQIERRS